MENKIQEWGETSKTGFWAGIDPPENGYTIITITSSRREPSFVVAYNDDDVIYFAKTFGGTNINTVDDAINYLLTGSTDTTIFNTLPPSIIRNKKQ